MVALPEPRAEDLLDEDQEGGGVHWPSSSMAQRMPSVFMAPTRLKLGGVLRGTTPWAGLPLGGGAKTPTLKALAGLARERWRIHQDCRELKQKLGLDHFEGRSWRGWRYHVSLVCLAHLFLQSERAQPLPEGAHKKRVETSARESLPQTHRRLHALFVRLCCARCPWCASPMDTT